MTELQQAHEGQITPEELQTALDNFLDAKGTEQSSGAIRVEFFADGETAYSKSMEKRHPIERHPHEAITRYLDEDGSPVYICERIKPHFASSVRELSFQDGQIDCEREKVGVGISSTPEGVEKSTLTPEEVESLHAQALQGVNDPRWQTRQEAIESYGRAQHARGFRLGRFIARRRKTDTPKYS